MAMREGVSGEAVDLQYVTYDRLEPEDARSNSSKIKGPARLVTPGKSHFPRDKCLGKVKGQRKRKGKSCVTDSRYADPELVDPELPSSWKARQIAFRLSNSEDLSFVPAGSQTLHEAHLCPTTGYSTGDGPIGLGGLSAAFQSLTDSTHWPKFAHEQGEKLSNPEEMALSPSGPVEISSEAHMEMGVSPTPSDLSSLCALSLEAPVGGAAFEQCLGPAGIRAEVEAHDDEDIDSDWDLLSHSGSDWDII